MVIRAITREEEAELPTFRSHQAARDYFVAKYGDAFEIEDSFIVGQGDDATICYRYNLVLNREVYERGVRELMRGIMTDMPSSSTAGVSAMEFLASYQSIEIMLEGDVHVIH